jgi:hypothetical protein
MTSLLPVKESTDTERDDRLVSRHFDRRRYERWINYPVYEYLFRARSENKKAVELAHSKGYVSSLVTALHTAAAYNIFFPNPPWERNLAPRMRITDEVVVIHKGDGLLHAVLNTPDGDCAFIYKNNQLVGFQLPFENGEFYSWLNWGLEDAP